MKIIAIAVTVVNIILALLYIWFGNSKSSKGNEHVFFYSLAFLTLINTGLIWWY